MSARIEKLDAHTFKIVYKSPNPAWFQTFGGTACVIPKHVFEPFKGAKSREAPANLKPVGTGPVPDRRLQARRPRSGPS